MSHGTRLKFGLFMIVFGISLGRVAPWEMRDIIGWIGILALAVLLFTPQALAREWNKRQAQRISEDANGDLAPEDQIYLDRVPNRYLPWSLKDLTHYGVELVILLLASVGIAQWLRQ
jgi:hypothetical protein